MQWKHISSNVLTEAFFLRCIFKCCVACFFGRPNVAFQLGQAPITIQILRHSVCDRMSTDRMTAGGKGKSNRAMRTTKSLYPKSLLFLPWTRVAECACAVNYLWRPNAMQLQMRGLWNITQNVHGRTMAALRTEWNTKGRSRTCHLRSAVTIVRQ